MDASNAPSTVYIVIGHPASINTDVRGCHGGNTRGDGDDGDGAVLDETGGIRTGTALRLRR